MRSGETRAQQRPFRGARMKKYPESKFAEKLSQHNKLHSLRWQGDEIPNYCSTAELPAFSVWQAGCTANLRVLPCITAYKSEGRSAHKVYVPAGAPDKRPIPRRMAFRRPSKGFSMLILGAKDLKSLVGSTKSIMF
jgi:hypothetical protein